MTGDRGREVRCAIYTRKSSDEGLEQEFNSLDAQSCACQAYISSQKHEGWLGLAERFDDGGFSGGTLQRPALQRLLSMIDAGEVDMVVVYKIDRLTRSLADFGKLVEHFDRSACSFVSVTQSFNTSTSPGRLMLNVLLSFAQFEREITGERIRDKIAASKKKGMWMGGVAPLGYQSCDRKLVVVESEAEQVRKLFELFRLHRCLVKTRRLAYTMGIRSRPTGKHPTGPVLRQSNILWILTNPVYTGRVRHRQVTYEGLHEAIIGEAVWSEVQEGVTEYLASHSGGWAKRTRKSWLAGKVFQHAVWLYFRFTLSFRYVEEVLAQRRIDVSCETIHCRTLKFGPKIAANLRRRKLPPSPRWRLDEMVSTIAGERDHIWRAVDDEGEVMDMVVQKQRDTSAALRLMRRLLRNSHVEPETITTDGLRSYPAALKILV